MRSFRAGNLAVLTLSAVLLLIMVTYSNGAATRQVATSSSSPPTPAVARMPRQEEEDDSNTNRGGGQRRKAGGKRKSGSNRKGGNTRKGGGKRKRNDLEEDHDDQNHKPANYTMTCECGKKFNMRISGGAPSIRNEYPWQVAVLYEHGELLCGGTLINDLYVLTAASCLGRHGDDPVTEFKVRLRDHNIGKKNQSKEITKSVAEIMIHKSYKPPSHKNDIALVKLDSKIMFPGTPLVAPICLPSSKSELYEDKKVTATGWGMTEDQGALSNVLQEVVLKVESNENCVEAGHDSKDIKKTMICAGKRWNKGICRGDFGGPLIYENAHGRFEQIGISSFTRAKCGESNKEPSVFTRVNKYLRWIKRKTRDATYCSGFAFEGDKPPHGPDVGHPVEPPHGPDGGHPVEPPHGPDGGHPVEPPHILPGGEHPVGPPPAHPEEPQDHPEEPQHHPEEPPHLNLKDLLP